MSISVIQIAPLGSGDDTSCASSVESKKNSDSGESNDKDRKKEKEKHDCSTKRTGDQPLSALRYPGPGIWLLLP